MNSMDNACFKLKQPHCSSGPNASTHKTARSTANLTTEGTPKMKHMGNESATTNKQTTSTSYINHKTQYSSDGPGPQQMDFCVEQEMFSNREIPNSSDGPQQMDICVEQEMFSACPDSVTNIVGNSNCSMDTLPAPIDRHTLSHSIQMDHSYSTESSNTQNYKVSFLNYLE